MFIIEIYNVHDLKDSLLEGSMSRPTLVLTPQKVNTNESCYL